MIYETIGDINLAGVIFVKFKKHNKLIKYKKNDIVMIKTDWRKIV
jgi:hypothetical protein